VKLRNKLIELANMG